MEAFIVVLVDITEFGAFHGNMFPCVAVDERGRERDADVMANRLSITRQLSTFLI